MLAKAAFPAFFLTLSAFILFLLVTLSTPIIDKFYLLEARYPGGQTAAHLGVFGACFKAPPSGQVPTPSSTGCLAVYYLEAKCSRGRIQGVGGPFCTEPKAGYDFPIERFGVAPGSDAANVLTKSLAGALVINAVAAGIAGICLIWAFFAWFCASRGLEITTFVFTLLGAIFAALAFFLDLGVVIAARTKLNDFTDDRVTGHIGNAFWMAMGGTIAMFLAICAAGCGSFGRYSQRYAPHPGYANRY